VSSGVAHPPPACTPGLAPRPLLLRGNERAVRVGPAVAEEAPLFSHLGADRGVDRTVEDGILLAAESRHDLAARARKERAPVRTATLAMAIAGRQRPSRMSRSRCAPRTPVQVIAFEPGDVDGDTAKLVAFRKDGSDGDAGHAILLRQAGRRCSGCRSPLRFHDVAKAIPHHVHADDAIAYLGLMLQAYAVGQGGPAGRRRRSSPPAR